MICTDVIVTFI